MPMYRPTSTSGNRTKKAVFPAGATVEIANTAAQARTFEADWQALADCALDANPFLAPWCLIPALEAYGKERETCLAFVYQGQGIARNLIGVFPLELREKFRGLPLRHLISWQHPQLFLAQPLVNPDHAKLAWREVLTWAKQQGAQLIELPLVSSESATMQALESALAASALNSVTLASFERALLTPSAQTSQDYITASSSAKSRKSWRRQNRRLGELGTLDCRVMAPKEPVDPWIDDFLSLEVKSWKGRDGTALASQPHEERFFRDMARDAHTHNALHMMGLFLDGKAIALQCNLFSGGDGFAFKVAFDDAFSSLSPGVLLELAAIENFFDRDGFRSIDSCTGAGHPLMSRLWRETRQIDHILASTGRLGGQFLCRFYPLARSLRSVLKTKGTAP